MGLGLSLVRSIVEAHQGAVWAESEEGTGSTFFVWLPFVDFGRDKARQDEPSGRLEEADGDFTAVREA